LISNTLDEIRNRYSRWLFDGPLPAVEIAFLGVFSFLAIFHSLAFSALTFAVFALVIAFAVAERRVTDLALLSVTYYVFRFQLIESSLPFKYLSDVLFLLGAVGVIWLLLTHRARLRSYDYLFGAWAVFAFVVSQMRGVPIIPSVIQMRALLAVYPLMVFMREVGFDARPDRHAAAVRFGEFCAWWIFGQAVLEKVTGKLVLPTLFVSETCISRTNFPRVYGWISNPNSLGALCVLMIALVLLYQSRGGDPKISRRVIFALTATLALSVSRSAAIGLVVFFGLLFFAGGLPRLDVRSLRALLARPVAAGIALAVVVTLLGTVVPRMINAAFSGDTGLSMFERFITDDEEIEGSMIGGRLFSLRTGLDIATSDVPTFFIGSGLATFGSAGSNFWESPLYEPYGIPEGFYADLFYGMMLVEVGLVGLLLYVGGVVVMAFSSRGIPFAWRMGVLSLFLIWNIFYNVAEIHSVFSVMIISLGCIGGTTRSGSPVLSVGIQGGMHAR